MFACRIWNPGLWNLESWALESGIQLKESGILLKTGIQNPGFNDKEIRNPRRGVQNPRLSWIPLRGAKSWRGPKELPYVAAGLVTRDLDQRDLYRGLIDCLRYRLGGTCYEMAYVLISIRKNKTRFCWVAIIALSNQVFPAGVFSGETRAFPCRACLALHACFVLAWKREKVAHVLQVSEFTVTRRLPQNHSYNHSCHVASVYFVYLQCFQLQTLPCWKLHRDWNTQVRIAQFIDHVLLMLPQPFKRHLNCQIQKRK